MNFNQAIATLSLTICVIFHPQIAGSAEPKFVIGEDPFWELDTISNDELSAMRGGFITADGLEISIGYEQASYINGVLQATASFDISQLKPVVKADMLEGIAPATVNIISNGPGNFVTADVINNFDAGTLTIIQNSLDGQVLQNYTVLDIKVGNFRNYKPNNLLGEMIDFQISESLY